MRVGWLEDYPPYVGGAELTAEDFRIQAPPHVIVKKCSQEHMARNVDVYVVQNCTQFDARIIPYLEDAPVVKYIHDLWPHGDRDLRNWLIYNSKKVVFTSPMHAESFSPEVPNHVCIPPFLDVKRFHAARLPADRREGTAWMGRIHPAKGLKKVAEWADENEEDVDVFGKPHHLIPDHPRLRHSGVLEPNEVPETLACYSRFIHLPIALEPYGRSVAEAWAAGCELITNPKVGATHWLKGDGEELSDSPRKFWNLVEEVCQSSTL